MKSVILLSVIWLAALSGCTSSFQTATISSDLYQVHSRTEIAERQKAEAEAAKAEAEARKALWELKLAEAKAAAAEAEYNQTLFVGGSSVSNDFSSVLADDYESAYARRLYGFDSPTYRMPSSYYNLRYSDAYFYASAYDPAFYNVMVAGDQVWVEPKYVTSMFGSWGAAVVPTYSWYYGWNYPFNSTWWTGYYPRYSWYGWGYPYYGPYPPYFGGVPSRPRPPHYVGGKPHRPNVAHRPNTSRPGGSPSFSGGSRPGSPSHSTAPSGRTNVRRSSGTVTGSGQYRGSSSGSGSQYRSGSSNTRSSSSSSSNGGSYRSGSSGRGSYSSGSSSGRGGYGGGYGGGGNYSGSGHGGGQRR